jgi:putative NADH-flavin reductase
MRITVLGGTGYVGAAVAGEAAKRGHQVRALSRTAPAEPISGVSYLRGSVLDPDVLAGAVADTDVIVEALAPRGDMTGKLEDVITRLISLADVGGVRLGVIGGASSLLLSEDGPRFFDVHTPPAEVRPEVEYGLWKLETFQASPDTLDWFFVSPAANFGAWLPQRVTGTYRTSDDVLLTDEAGESYISAADLATAVLDEIERPAHHRRRFHVAL